MNEVKIEDFKGIQGYHKKMTIDGHIYLKPSGIVDDKVKAYFMKLRSTTFVDDLEKRFGYTDFLKGVLGNVMWFEVHDDFMNKSSTDNERGSWVHFSIAFPLLCMSGTANLMYAANEIQQAMEEVVGAKQEARTLSVALTKAHSEIQMLKGEIQMNNQSARKLIPIDSPKNTNKIEPSKELPAKVENQKNLFGEISIYIPFQKWYPLSFINKLFKDANATLTNGDMSEFCFSTAFQSAAKDILIIDQTDEFHFELLNDTVAKTYKPSRQEKARYNKPGVPVQYFSLNKKGLKWCFGRLLDIKAFNEKIQIIID